MKRAISKQAGLMAEATKQPWRCAPCKRLVKAVTVYCPSCGGHWTQIQDVKYRPSQPAQPTYQAADWTWETWADQSAASRPRSPRKRSQSQRRKGKGGKGADQKEASGALSFPSLPPSPFQALTNSPGSYAAAVTTPPWTSERAVDNHAANYELIQAVKKAYPDPSGMPAELKEILDKNESTEMKKITSELHKATAALGRATRQLQELQETKAQHRTKWLQHLTASLDAWQSQTESYDKQQEQFNSLIQQANQELLTARTSIQQLNAKAAKDQTLMAVPEELPVMPAALGESPPDTEEQKLRVKMQEVMKATALATAPVEQGGDGIPAPKRPRSQDRTGDVVDLSMEP